MESWVLDLVVKGGKVLDPRLTDPVWLIVKVDGCPQQFATPPTAISSGPTWNFGARLILSVRDLAAAYLYFAMCLSGPRTIATSRIGLWAVPHDNSRQFSFPLRRALNDVARLTLQASVTPMIKVVMRTYNKKTNARDPNGLPA